MQSTITTKSELITHIEALIELEPRFSGIYTQTGVPSIRHRDGGFLHVCRTIVSQQLSVAAADSIWQRLVVNAFTTETALLSASEEKLRQCGLSKQKIRYIKSLATHHIDYETLPELNDKAIINILTAVTGIGNWTAEIYCLFALNRSDVFAHNDLALQVATQAMLNLDKRPTESTMRKLAAPWSPHRSAAAYLLWKYYAVLKGREGINL